MSQVRPDFSFFVWLVFIFSFLLLPATSKTHSDQASILIVLRRIKKTKKSMIKRKERIGIRVQEVPATAPSSSPPQPPITPPRKMETLLPSAQPHPPSPPPPPPVPSTATTTTATALLFPSPPPVVAASVGAKPLTNETNKKREWEVVRPNDPDYIQYSIIHYPLHVLPFGSHLCEDETPRERRKARSAILSAYVNKLQKSGGARQMPDPAHVLNNGEQAMEAALSREVIKREHRAKVARLTSLIPIPPTLSLS